MTTIEWTDLTWNPIAGCSMAPGSETGGCLNCYAARMAARNLPNMRSQITGQPFAIMTDSGPRWTGGVELIRDRLALPAHWITARQVFVNSMSDLFHEALPFWVIDDVFDAMLTAPWHYYQTLTKRARRMYEYFDTSSNRSDYLMKLSRLTLGVSVENPKTAAMRLPFLLQVPAPYRMVSYEPALELIDFRAIPAGAEPVFGTFDALTEGASVPNRRIDWLVIGGESGPGARPFRLEWARKTIKDCRATGVPLFLKQVGAHPIGETQGDLIELVKIADPKGCDPAEWPPDLRDAREFPYAKSNL